MYGFTECELVRLSRMRHRCQAGFWSGVSNGRPLDERLGTVIAAIPLGVSQNGAVCYRCVVTRLSNPGRKQREVLFQVMPIYPAPPDAREVLPWLAAAVANLVLTPDLGDWGCLSE